MKTAIEVEIEKPDKLQALLTFARLLELSERHNPDQSMEYLHEVDFWDKHLPQALKILAVVLRYLVTDVYFKVGPDAVPGVLVWLFSESAEWDHAMPRVLKTFGELDLMRQKQAQLNGSTDLPSPNELPSTFVRI